MGHLQGFIQSQKTLFKGDDQLEDKNHFLTNRNDLASKLKISNCPPYLLFILAYFLHCTFFHQHPFVLSLTSNFSPFIWWKAIHCLARLVSCWNACWWSEGRHQVLQLWELASQGLYRENIMQCLWMQILKLYALTDQPEFKMSPLNLKCPHCLTHLP